MIQMGDNAADTEMEVKMAIKLTQENRGKGMKGGRA